MRCISVSELGSLKGATKTSSSCVILCMHRTRSAHISQHLHSTHSSYACDNAMQQRLQENDGTARTGSDGR